MAVGKKITELSRESKNNLTGDGTFVYVVNNNVSKHVDLNSLLYNYTLIPRNIAANAITVDKIANGAIEAGKIAANAINDTHIQALAINADKVAANAITVAKIADGAIEAGKIAANAVNETHIQDLTINADKIAVNAITETKIASNSISTGKIQSNAITANKISAGSVTTNKLLVTSRGAALNADPGFQDSSAWVEWTGNTAAFGTTTSGAVGNRVLRSTDGTAWYNSAELLPLDRTKTYRIKGTARRNGTANGKLYIGVALFDSSGVNITGDGAQWFYGAASALTLPDTSFKNYSAEFGFDTDNPFPANARSMKPLVILNYTGTIGYMEAQDIRIEEKINGELIVDGVITAAKIAANAITAGKIAANAVTAGTIAAGAVTANEIKAGTITASQIAAGTITSTQIKAGTITGNNITAYSLSAAQIATGAITSRNIAAGAITASDIASGTISSAIFTLNTNSGVIKSNNYSNTAGFQIRGSGDAVFNDVTIRGTIKQSKIIVDDSVNLYRSDALTKPAKPTMRVRGYDTSGVVYASNYGPTELRGQRVYESQVKIYGRNATGATIDNRFLCDSSNNLTLDITADAHYWSNDTEPPPIAPRIAISNNNGSTWDYYTQLSGQTAQQFDISMEDIDYEGFNPSPFVDTHTRMQWAWRKGRIVLLNVAANAILTIAIELIPRSDNGIPAAQYRNLNLDVQVSNWN